MQHWIDRSGIADRPMPKLGPTAEETAEEKREALAWAMESGAVHAIVSAYRCARPAGDEHLTAFNKASDMAKHLGRPLSRIEDTTRTVLEWAKDNYPP